MFKFLVSLFRRKEVTARPLTRRDKRRIIRAFRTNDEKRLKQILYDRYYQ